METTEDNQNTNNDNGSTSTGETNVFARSGKLQRSPVRSTMTPTSAGTSRPLGEAKGGYDMLLSQMFTPKRSDSAPRDALAEIRAKVDELYEYVKVRHNVHQPIKNLVASIKSAVVLAEDERDRLRARATTAENALNEAGKKTREVMTTPRRPPEVNSRSEKRKRETPGDKEEQKKAKNDGGNNAVQGEQSGWRTVETRRERRKRTQNGATQKVEQKKPRRERSKGDALVVEANANVSYAAILRKVREAPELKELGEKVVRTRRTQKGEMLFELQKDPSVKSSAFKELVAKALGNEANVKALSQETVIECRDLDEITTEDELRSALRVQCELDDVPLVIRLRKAYGGTQTATIRLSAVTAPKLLKKGKIKVGWSVCVLKAIPRVAKQMERCFKCWGFGHQARNCEGPDRSKSCRKCGVHGHFASDCTKPPRCMLCKSEDGNDHVTGGFKCPTYKKAKASQQ